MTIIPVFWSFRSESSAIPIIEINGQSIAKESEITLIQGAVKIIDDAGKFKGIPYIVSHCPPTNYPVKVFFSLIFPSVNNLDSFMDNLKRIINPQS